MMKKSARIFSALSLFCFLLGCALGCTYGPYAITTNQTGYDGGYYYSFWTNGGTVAMTLDGKNGYSVTWSGVGDFVVGKGWNPSNNANIAWTGSVTGANYFGVYGWLSSPLTEYYIGRGGGNSAGTYSTSRGTYTLNTVSCNGANITGNGSFTQFNCDGPGSSPINMAEHFSNWGKLIPLQYQTITQNYVIVSTEAWDGGSGSANVTITSP